MQYILGGGGCPFTFADIAHHIIMTGENGSYWWMNKKDEGKVVVCGTDGFRPVFFRVEKYCQDPIC